MKCLNTKFQNHILYQMKIMTLLKHTLAMKCLEIMHGAVIQKRQSKI